MSIKNKYIDEGNQFSEEVQNVIAQTKIEWAKSKEDIWMEMEAKLEQKNTPAMKKVYSFSLPKVAQYVAAAMIALLIGFTATAALYTKKIKTDFAEQKSIILPDNSKVNLYANSTFSYKPLMWKISRTTRLTGEAFFEVEKGKTFEVISAKAKTVVLGTRFLVKARNSEYDVNCENGKVMIVEASKNNKAIIVEGESAELLANNKFKITSSKKIQNNLVPEQKPESTNEKRNPNTENKIKITDNSVIEPDNKKEAPQQPNQPKEEHRQNTHQEKAINNTEPPTQTEEITNIIEEIKISEQGGKQDKAAVQQQKKEVDNGTEAAKKRFRNSLTKKQIAILEDNTLSKAEKQRAFMKSLTDEQKALLKEQNNVSASKGAHNANAMKENLQNEQGSQTKNQMRNSLKNDVGGQIKGNRNGKKTLN